MTFYVTPFGRTRRMAVRQFPQAFREEEYDQPQSDVFVPVNVKAGNDEYIITALVPGVTVDELTIQVVNETVTLQGEIKDESAEGDSYLVREQPVGRFYRAIRLPEPLDSARASADLTNGVLTLRVPKTEEARPRRIKVNAN